MNSNTTQTELTQIDPQAQADAAAQAAVAAARAAAAAAQAQAAATQAQAMAASAQAGTVQPAAAFEQLQPEQPSYQLKGHMKVEDGKVTGLDPVDNAIVGTYFKIQDGVVGTYKKIEDAFVGAFLERSEDAKGADAQQTNIADVPDAKDARLRVLLARLLDGAPPAGCAPFLVHSTKTALRSSLSMAFRRLDLAPKIAR